MTVNEISKVNGFESVILPDGDREVTGVYIGDLLSWVMGKANSGDAWITIMSNINVIAVASLADVSCVLLAEGVTLDDEVLTTAKEKGINILSTPLAAYEAAVRISGIM
jgi:predicted transcriptional regulator